MESRALLAFAISVAILVGWQLLFEPVPSRQPAAGTEQTLATSPLTPTTVPAAPVPAPLPGFVPSQPVPEERQTKAELSTNLYRAVVTSGGGRLASFGLFNYRTDIDPSSPPLDMVDSNGALPLALYWRGKDGKLHDDRGVNYQLTVGSGGLDVTMTGRSPSGLQLTKRLMAAPDSYLLDYEASVEGAAELGVAWTRRAAETNRFGRREGPVALIDGELEQYMVDSLDEPETHDGQVAWAGYSGHYFLAAFCAPEAVQARFTALSNGEVGESLLWSAAPGGTVSYKLFVGPKSLHMLEEVGFGLGEAIDLGWFTVIARPLLELLLFFNSLTGNFGVAILLLTVGVRVVFYPVNKKQATAMKAMQRIQPELKKIQAKFKDDRERLNKEMMDLYKRHKVNPLAGCFPMLLQLPVFIGLYNALLSTIELRHSPFLGWITDLSQPDRLGALAIPFVHPPGIPVMTLLMGASMVLQQRMTPQMGDPTQQRMMMFMPVIFTVMFVNFPSGLVLYWLTNNILSIAQQYMNSRSAN